MSSYAHSGATGSGHRLVDLTEDECWDLVRGQVVGRLAWNHPSGPRVIPLNYAVSDETIRVTTSAYSIAAREADDSPITFEIDDIDARERTGWSVLAHGTATMDWSYGRVSAPEVDVWPTGARPLRLRLEITEITGRRISGA